MLTQTIDEQLDAAFGGFSARIASLAAKANRARAALKEKMDDVPTIDTGGDTVTGPGRAIRDYENALEELKGFIQNRNCGHVHNENLKWMIDGQTHAIRALEVALVHSGADDWRITGVVVRGLISVEPADGNEAPSYSSKSSSSSVAASA